eukprot:5986356-Amphidinium_carterae.4
MMMRLSMLSSTCCVVSCWQGKARSKEVVWSSMTESKKLQCTPALEKEWQNWESSSVAHIPTAAEDAIIMSGELEVVPTRWVLIDEVVGKKENGEEITQPKARLVAQGCFEYGSGSGATYA